MNPELQQHIDILIELGKKINSQDHRSTAGPLYVVQERVKMYHSNGSETERKDIDYMSQDDLCEACRVELEKTGELPLTCETDDCDSDTFICFDWEWEFKLHHGVFLTGEACDEYIQRRSYEFGKDVRSYAISTYWSYDMGRALHAISALGNAGEPHQNYRHSK